MEKSPVREPSEVIFEYIESLEQQIADLQKKLQISIEFARANNLIDTNSTVVKPARNDERQNPPFGGSKWHTPIGDATVQLLKQSGERGLHIQVIKERLDQMDIHPTLASLDVALRKDKRKRFVLVDTRTYGLREGV